MEHAPNVPENLKNVRQYGKFTHQDMADIRLAQIQGEVNYITANNATSIPDEYFRKEYADYQIPDYEQNNYVVALEARLFDQQTGRKISVPIVQIFDPQTFEALKAQNGFYGKTTHILHNPTFGTGKKTQPKKETGAENLTNTGDTTINPLAPNEPPNKPNDVNEGDETTPQDEKNATQGEQTVGEEYTIDDIKKIDKIGEARKAYKSIMGKNPPPSHDLDTLKLAIGEHLGDVK